VAPEETYLTPQGLRQLQEELDQLRSVRRQEVADRIQEAKEIGGTVDNAEYEEAKNEQSFVEGRIIDLEAMIQSAVIIPDHSKSKGGTKSGVIEIGSIVTVQSAADNKKRKYTIVGTTEAAPAEGRISNESPIGRALLGKKVGQTVEFTVPSGVQRLKVLEVR